MANHNDLGNQGELLAKEYLQEKGYIIKTTNFRFKYEEVDIIAVQNNTLVVIEVKTRQSTYLAGPEVTVSKNKQRSIIKVANFYINKYNIDLETRFDVISIILNKTQTSIQHLTDAFYPLY